MHRLVSASLRLRIATLALGSMLCACDKGDAKPDAKPDAATKPAADAKAVADAKAPVDAKAPETKAPVDAKAVETKAPVEPEVAAPPEPVPPPTEATEAGTKPGPTGPVFKEVDGEKTLDLTYEGVGGITVDMPAADVEAKLGKPTKKDAIEMEGATGNYVQTWDYAAVGLEVGMKAEKRKGPQTVAYVKASRKCTLPASWGLQIGSTRAELEKVYGSNFDPDLTNDETFIAGSVYWGVSYELADGKVTSIFIGAGAE